MSPYPHTTFSRGHLLVTYSGESPHRLFSRVGRGSLYGSVSRLRAVGSSQLRADSTSRQMTPTWQKTKYTDFNWSADQFCLSFHWTVVANLLVADQLKLFYLFHMKSWQPEQRLGPFISVYRTPRFSNQCI